MPLTVLSTLEPTRFSAIEGDESATQRKLISVGERLLGERGFNGISLQDIAAEAGLANKYSVQYHFGSREAFLRVIFEVRGRSIEQRRRHLLNLVHRSGEPASLSSLLEVLAIPIAEQVDEFDRHSYARLVLQYLSRPNTEELADQFGGGCRAHDEVFEMLATRLGVTKREAENRFAALLPVILVALINRDNREAQGHGAEPVEEVLAESVRLVGAACVI